MSSYDNTQQPESEDDFLSQDERTSVRRLLKFPEEFPRDFGAWMIDYMGTNGFFQKSQVQGLPLLNSQVQDTLDTLSVIGTTYQDSYSTAVSVSNGVQSDPVVSVPAGTYFCILSAQGQITDGAGSVTMQLYDVSGAAAFGSIGKVEAGSVPGNITGIMSVGSVTVSGSSNDIKMTCTKSGSGNRWIGNLTLVVMRTG